MKINDLIKIVDSAYPNGEIGCDGTIGRHWDFAKSRPRRKKTSDYDGLAQFIVCELADAFDPKAPDEEQLLEAIRVMERASKDCESVTEAIESAHGKAAFS